MQMLIQKKKMEKPHIYVFLPIAVSFHSDVAAGAALFICK